MINIQRQPIDFTRYPDTIDIHKIVTGLPSIKNVLALERSALVNQRLRNMSIAGITALSTTPSMNLMTIRKLTLLIIPVAIASPPHRISDQNINFLALLFAAYNAPGIWKKKYPKKNNELSREDIAGVILRSSAIPPAVANPKFARSR
jgi:hypothetical protein